MQELFTITNDHLKLIQRINFNFNDNSCNGGLCQSTKRPYGNSDMCKDIAYILNWELTDKELSEEQMKMALKLHEELYYALNICCQFREFKTGRYISTSCGWEKLTKQNRKK